MHANRYLPELTANDGASLRLVAPPSQFDERPTVPSGPASELGQHTEEVLLDFDFGFGFGWDETASIQEKGTLG